jgi:MFS transporter, YNFM family, putative membrane transport protein
MPSLREPALEELALEQKELAPASSASLRPYRRVIAVFLCGAFAFLDLYCTQPLLPLLSHIFRATETSVSSTVSASTLGVAISAALLALFGERMDRKRTIICSMIGLAVVTALAATAPNLQVLAIWRLMQGLLTPGIFITTIAYVTEEWPARQVPRVMSFYVAGTVFGGFVGRVSGGLLAEDFGWRLMFVILGAAGLIGAHVTTRLLAPACSGARQHAVHSRLAPMLRNLRDVRLLSTFGLGFCMLFTLVSLFSYITFYLANAPFYLSTAKLSWLFAVYLFGLLATLAVGTVLARIGLLHGIIGAIGLCFAGVALTLWPSLLAVGIGLSLASSGVFISQTCANSFLRDAAPLGGRVSAAGMYICSYYIGGTVGGILPGLLWKQTGWPGCVALICTFLTIAASLAFFGWRRKPPIIDPIPL